MDSITQTLALSLGAAWASGINLYAAVATLGILAASGNIALPPELSVLSHPLVITAAVVMYCVEFFADKIPGIDSAWDALHTFIRIPAGAVLAAGAVGSVDPAFSFAAGLLGGTLAASTHATKAGTRVMINTSPEPFSNWFASLSEDVAVIVGLWTALHHPFVFLLLLFFFVVALFFILPLLWKGISSIFRGLRRLFGGSGTPRTELKAQGNPG